MTSDARREVAQQFFGGVVVEDVTTFGQRVDVCVRVDADEVARRRQVRTGAIVSEDVLRLLASLPSCISLPVELLDPLQRLVLEEALELHAVEMDGPTTFRLAARPPLEPIGLVLVASDWADVVALSFLGTLAPRVVVASGTLARRVLRDTGASLGVVANGEIVRPPLAHRVRDSWQRWLTSELAFERFLGA